MKFNFVRKKILSFKKLDDGWNGFNGSKSFSKNEIERAINFLDFLEKKDIPSILVNGFQHSFHVEPLYDGVIEFELKISGYQILFNFIENGDFDCEIYCKNKLERKMRIEMKSFLDDIFRFIDVSKKYG